MKVYALVTTRGQLPGLDYEIFAVTHARSIGMACRKFGVTPVTETSTRRWGPDAVEKCLPLPPKAEDPEFVQVDATKESASEVGHVLSVPERFEHCVNMGAWVCELPTLD